MFEARILGWVAIPFSRDLPDRGIEPRSSTLEADSLPSEPPGKPLISDCIVSYQKGLSCIESRSRCKGSIYLGLKLLQFLWNPLKGRLRSTYCILSHQRLPLLLLFNMQVGLYPSMVAYMATHIELSGRPTSPDYTGFLSLSFFFSPTIQSIQKYFLFYNLTITTLEQNHHLLSLNCHDSLLICLPTIISVSLLFICHIEARLFFIWIIFLPSKNRLLTSSHT